MTKPIAIDLFCGLGGWTEGFLAEGYEVIGFDIERHDYGTGGYPAQLVIQDALTLHGSQFRGAAVIVASPPCQKYSYMAMPWTRAKKLAAWYREDPARIEELNVLFSACFRIADEAGVPLIVENVRGAIPWVGQSRWHYGSFHLWGDVPALMPMTQIRKGFGGTWFHNAELGTTNPNRSRTAVDPATKNNGGSWFNVAHNTTSGVGNNPDGDSRKAASAQIAKIPFPLARHIARCFKPINETARQPEELCV